MTMRHLLLAVALLTAAPVILAQQDSVRDTRLREALRRSQSDLRSAEDKSSALSKDNAALKTDKQRDADALLRSGAQLNSVRGEASALRSKVDSLTTDLASLRAADQAERGAATIKLDDLAKRLVASETALRERTQTVIALRALLERSTSSLTEAQASNRKMYAFGRDLIEQYRKGTPAEQVLVSEPVLGFGSIRLENNAEELRSRLEAARIPPK